MTQKQNSSSGMNALEKRSVSGLAGIYALRMLGLFMILPVFSLAAQQYSNATPFLIGIAIGAYGLTQALFQIPFGMLSDRIGRKRVITIGLLLFALGSLVAAIAESIEMVIIGRLLQGSGAISAAVMALTADLTRDEQRTKAMASIGLSIGFAFSLALATGTALEEWIGLSGIFWVTALMAVFGIAVLYLWVPTPARCQARRDMAPASAQFLTVISNPNIMRLVVSIMCLHLLLTTSFFALPLTLFEQTDLAPDEHTGIYLPILILAFVTMVPFIIIAEKRRKMKSVFIGSVVVLATVQLIWAGFGHSMLSVLIGLWLFFTAFNILEASLPSMMSKLCPLENKGTALGIYSTAQFFGAFIGGATGGLLHGQFGLTSVFIAGAVIAIVWLYFILPIETPRRLSTRILELDPFTDEQANEIAQRLHAIKGVVDTLIVTNESVAYVKYMPEEIDDEQLDAFSVSSS